MAVDFGTDTSCTTAMRTGRLVSGLRLVGEAVFRRLTTPRGTLQGGAEEQNYGLDLGKLIGSVKTKADRAALGGQIQTELLKDERLESVIATVNSSTIGPVTDWEISVECDTAAGPFALVIGVSGVSVDLLGFTEG